jgi:hypothetical protein
MIVQFSNADWPKSNLGAVFQKQQSDHSRQERYICVSVAPSIQFLKHQSLTQAIVWAMSRNADIHIRFREDETILQSVTEANNRGLM